MLFSGGCVFQIPQRDPARHEGLLFERVDGQRPGIFGELIGKLWVAVLQSSKRQLATLRPPLIERCYLGWIGRYGQDDLGGFFDFARLAQHLFAVELQTKVVAALALRIKQSFTVARF